MDNKRAPKSKYLKKTLLAAAAACMAVVLCSCTTYNSFRQTYITKADPESTSDPAITIGVIEPQTGRYADKGKAELKGIELANSIYNNVDGYKVELVKVDTQSSVSATRTAIQALLEMKPAAIIGTAGDASSLTITDYVDEAEIPAITPSATNPLITQSSQYYFRACMTDSQMGEGLAEYAASRLNAERIAVISIKNDTSTSALLDGFYDSLKKEGFSRARVNTNELPDDDKAFSKDIAGINRNEGGRIAAYTEITPDENGIDNAISMLKGINGVDACFVSLGTEEMDTFFSKIEDDSQLKDLVILGTREWGSADFTSMVSDKHPDMLGKKDDSSAARVVFPYESVLSKTDDTSDTVTEEAQRFQIEYANRYGVDDVPTDNAALGYDSYLLVINAIHNAKTLEGSEIRESIRNLSDLKCATGVFNFDDSGNVVRAVTLSTIKDGKPVTEYVTRSEAEARKLEDIENAESEE